MRPFQPLMIGMITFRHYEYFVVCLQEKWLGGIHATKFWQRFGSEISGRAMPYHLSHLAIGQGMRPSPAGHTKVGCCLA